MNKMLYQAIMKRSRLKNKANKTKNHLEIRNYKKQLKIELSENGDLISKHGKIANTFNDYFGSIIENMNLYHWKDKHFSIPKDSDIIKNITHK